MRSGTFWLRYGTPSGSGKYIRFGLLVRIETGGERTTIIVDRYKGSGRGGLSASPSSVLGNALVMIYDSIESVNVKNRYQGARVSARRANREPEDGIRWKFVHGRVSSVSGKKNCKFVLSRVLLMAYSSILLEYVLDSTYS